MMADELKVMAMTKTHAKTKTKYDGFVNSLTG